MTSKLALDKNGRYYVLVKKFTDAGEYLGADGRRYTLLKKFV